MAATLATPRIVLRTEAIMLALGGTLALVSWFFPWFALYLPLNDGSPVVVERSPYQMATTDPHTSVVAWFLFFFTLGWLGSAVACWRGQWLGWMIPVAFGLSLVMFGAVYDLLGEMGVLQMLFNGHAIAPGVGAIMQLGFVPMLAALLLGGIVAARLARVIWGRGV